MARPLYENAATLEEEIKFFRDLTATAEYADCRFRKLPLSYRLECAIEHTPTGKITGFCEFKRRRCVRTQYPTLLLSLQKYRELVACGEYGDALLFVRWNDRDGVYEVTKDAEVEIEWGGRTDRGDWQDEEPVVHIPVDDFEMLKTKRKDFTEVGKARVEKVWKSGKGWAV